jgi:hypothetical protein
VPDLHRPLPAGHITIDVVNYARWLNGVQLALVNYARSNPPGLPVLRLINVNLSEAR